MNPITRIQNEQELEEVLSRLRKGAEYIESPEFQKKSEDYKRAANAYYDQLAEQVHRYKGWI
ncbi:hypothetical protein [Thermoactinomyces sp. DSM 45892]|uniref:hypothetical protein n=1 Tax=Thermoactinomyces sp. DSM 45892 TaxID=1882753 RepID=UPI0008972F87|nr:hypothetical protein [Thermoactinomyces sp. DSM 45892]SDY22537.1 hypothetical protein SAMN05444416_10328 [Thermoactinomyces sp. DSM 45892]